MRQFSDRVTTGPQTSARMDALDLLTMLGWWGGLSAIVAGLVISFFAFGYTLIYWRNADMDLVVIYNALALNDGYPQYFFDHTGYITILLTKFWFQLLHSAGLLDIFSLREVPPASNAAAFDAAMTSAVRAGRILAWLIASVCTLVFTALVRLVVRDWRIALIATFAFAFSGGMAVHARILRTELVAACPVLFALMILIVVGRRASIGRPLAMALAAALCTLGLENKVQVIMLMAAIPLVILPFGSEDSASVAFWKATRGAWMATAVAAAVAIVAAWLTSPLIATGLDQALIEAAKFHPLMFGRFGFYQPLLLFFFAVCMVIYARIWRISATETLTSMLAMAAAALFALLVLDIQYNGSNVIAIINPLEKMLAFADDSNKGAASGSGLAGFLLLVLRAGASVFARYTFALYPSPRPAVFLTWLIVPGIVYAWRRGQGRAALQALLLMLAAFGIDTLGALRGLKSEYFIITDPLIILAGAILLDRMIDLSSRRLAYSFAVLLFGAHLFVSQAEPVKAAYAQTGPERICEWNWFYLPLLPLPWCNNPPVQP